jgi:hypothetical protein
VGAGAIGHVSEDLGPVLELNPVDAVGKRLNHDPLHEWGALGHEPRLYQTRVSFSGRTRWSGRWTGRRGAQMSSRL